MYVPLFTVDGYIAIAFAKIKGGTQGQSNE